jgi:tRNA(Leu) C34 or U34 (ribose-2'-O)-methylase TrmL
VEDPRNLGAVLRTVDAAGGDGVLLPDRHSAGLSDTVARASAGGLEHVKVARIGNVAQALERLKEKGVWVVGLDASGSERWDQVDYKRAICLVMGGEGRGIRRLVRERCDHLVSLPMFGHVGSLNISVAAGIALYEVVRQRGAVPSHVRPIPHHAPHGSRHVIGPGPEDDEHDPGARREPAAAAAAGDEDDDTITLAYEHDEEPAWAAGGPTILKAPRHRDTRVGGPARPRRGRHGGRGGGGGAQDRRIAPRGERRPRDLSESAPAPEGEPGAPPGARPDAGAVERDRGRRKRRRHRPDRNREARGGGPAGSREPGAGDGGGDSGPGPGHGPGNGGHDGAQDGRSNASGGGPPGPPDGPRPGRRRRRRRRR